MLWFDLSQLWEWMMKSKQALRFKHFNAKHENPSKLPVDLLCILICSCVLEILSVDSCIYCVYPLDTIEHGEHL